MDRLRLRLRSLFRRRLVEQELDEEIQYHVDRQTEELIAKGCAPEQARFQALRAIGGVDQRKEECRDARHLNFISDLFKDLRYAFRMLRRKPSFTAVAVLSLAVGIGANTAAFSAIDPLFLQRLSVADPDRLVVFNVVRPDLHALIPWLSTAWIPRINGGITYRQFDLLRDRTRSFSQMFVLSPVADVRAIVDSSDPTGEIVRAQRASGSFFSTLGIDAVVGRTFTDDDARADAIPVAVISFRFWQHRFGQDPGVIGRQVTVPGGEDPRNTNGRVTTTIIGVAPVDFAGPEIGSNCCDMWLPLVGKANGSSPTEAVWWYGIGPMMARLKPGVSLEQAQTEVRVTYARAVDEWMAQFGSHWSPQQREQFLRHTVVAQPGATGWSRLREQVGQRLLILMGTVGIVLLIACANVAALLLARAADRQKELAVRLAIGSGRARLVRQLLTESLMLGMVGGLTGVGVAYAGIRLLLAYVPELAVLQAGLNLRVLLFTAAVSIGAALLFGIVPALRSTGGRLTPALKDGYGRYLGARSRVSINKVLVAVQITLSMILLVGAGLFVQTLQNLRHLDAGFDRKNVALFFLDKPLGLPDHPALTKRIQSFPGVESTTAWEAGLLGSSGHISSVGPLQVDGYVPGPNEDLGATATYVGLGYFQTLGISILSGRDFLPGDEQPNRNVAIVSATFAKHFFGDRNPVGKYFIPDGKPPQVEIIGVAEDTKYQTLREEGRQTIYVPFGSRYLESTPSETRAFAVRGSSNFVGLSEAIREAVKDTTPNIRVASIQTLEEVAENTLRQERFLAEIAGLFSGIAIFLACVGLYGTLSHAVVQRTNEIGIRMALGAQRRHVIRMVFNETGWTITTGLALGIIGALAVNRTISGLLFGLSPSDSLTIAGAGVVLVFAGVVAAWPPARRAIRVAPLEALRHD
jgi:predicted permease